MRQTRRENTAVERIASQVWTLNYWVLWQTLNSIEDWTTIGSYREAIVFNRGSLKIENSQIRGSRELERLVVIDANSDRKNKARK